MSCTILLPVDGTECSERAARDVVHIAGMVHGDVLLGSVVSKVLHLSNVPVTLVK